MVYSAIAPFSDTSEAATAACIDRVRGEICVLVWEGVGNLVPKWKRYTGRIGNGFFYVENSKKELVRWIRIAGEMEVLRVPSKWAFGKQHTIALMPENTPLKRAAENADVLMFALSDALSAARWMDHIQAARKEILQLTQPDRQGLVPVESAVSHLSSADSMLEQEIEETGTDSSPGGHTLLSLTILTFFCRGSRISVYS